MVPSTPSIIMFSMFRPVTLILAVAAVLLGSAVMFAQTPPPGAPFDASKHFNPIITFVETKDFKPATSEEVRKDIGIELLGMSREEAEQKSMEVAPGRFVKNMSILGFRT